MNRRMDDYFRISYYDSISLIKIPFFMCHNQKFIVNVWDPKTRFNNFM